MTHLHHGLVDMLLPLVRDALEVAKADVGAVEARRSCGLGELEGTITLLALLAQVVAVRVHVAKPHRLARIRVPHHRRLRRGNHMDARLALIVLRGCERCRFNSEVSISSSRCLGDGGVGNYGAVTCGGGSDGGGGAKGGSGISHLRPLQIDVEVDLFLGGL